MTQLSLFIMLMFFAFVIKSFDAYSVYILKEYLGHRRIVYLIGLVIALSFGLYMIWWFCGYILSRC